MNSRSRKTVRLGFVIVAAIFCSANGCYRQAGKVVGDGVENVVDRFSNSSKKLDDEGGTDQKSISSELAERSVDEGGQALFKEGMKNQSDKGLNVCNKTSSPILSVAMTFRENGVWKVVGWAKIARGECLRDQVPVQGDKVYFHAFSGWKRWDGAMKQCIHPVDPFELRTGFPSCPVGHEMRGFKEFPVVNGYAGVDFKD